MVSPIGTRAGVELAVDLIACKFKWLCQVHLRRPYTKDIIRQTVPRYTGADGFATYYSEVVDIPEHSTLQIENQQPVAMHQKLTVLPPLPLQRSVAVVMADVME